MKLSVIVPTRNRADVLHETVGNLSRQDFSPIDYEIVVVDDGSSPPVKVKEPVRLIRLEGVERSAARNAGARAARGDVILFLDDDVSVDEGFLAAHLAAQREWPGVLAVGRIVLPEEEHDRPFLRFRRSLERVEVPVDRGLVAKANFCTAQNMSIPRESFLALGGFSEEIISGEDQDLALRHTGAGGRIVYLPEATGVHRDHFLDIESYCRRVEWGSEHVVPFCRRHPEWPDNEVRERVNGPIRWRQESLAESVRKAGKAVLALPPATWMLLHAIGLLERMAPQGALLDKAFRAALGVHLFRGYRKGLKRFGATTS
jgi:glycosyltransferase involved in cell wall biosynthesis